MHGGRGGKGVKGGRKREGRGKEIGRWEQSERRYLLVRPPRPKAGKMRAMRAATVLVYLCGEKRISEEKEVEGEEAGAEQIRGTRSGENRIQRREV